MIIPRAILPKIEKSLFLSAEKKPAIIIYGPRQIGKTTLVKHILNKYPENAEYFDCDYLDVQETFSYQKSHQVASVIKGLKLLILDEAQRIKDIGMVLKILVDHHPQTQIIATGSSSFELSNKINEPLTGRKVEFRLLPVSFQELTAKDNLITADRNLETLLRFGSYPALIDQNENGKEKMLKEIANSYLFKDIFTFQQLKKPELLTKLIRLLAFQIGSEVSFHEIAQQIGVDQTIVQKYLYLLEQAFVIFRLGSFKRNLRTELSKSRKVYFWDLGIRNTLIQNFNKIELRDDVGKLWENFCVLERLKYLNNQQISANSYFWRTYDKKKIDYIEEAGGKLQAFEFKWNPKKKTKKPQEFLQNYANSSFQIISRENYPSFIA